MLTEFLRLASTRTPPPPPPPLVIPVDNVIPDRGQIVTSTETSEEVKEFRREEELTSEAKREKRKKRPVIIPYIK